MKAISGCEVVVRMKVVILGGGIGGQVTSNLISKGLSKGQEIVLVDKRSEYEFSPSFLWVAVGWREPHQVTRSLSRLVKRNVKYVNAEVSKINPAERTVKTSAGDLTYDYLIIALGADLAPDAIPGFSESAHHIYTLKAAMQLREKINQFTGGKVVICIPSLPFKCPAAPYEAALLLDYHFRQRRMRDKVEFQFFTPEPFPCQLQDQSSVTQ